MKKISKKSILEYWQDYIKTTNPLIKDWLKRENLYLKKNIKKNSVILDVGCGFGRNIKPLIKKSKKIIGIDNNKKALKEVKNKLSKYKNLEIFLEDAKKIHFANNTFDYTICMGNTFGDFGKNKFQILKEMKRVTKNDGKIIISVYSEKALKIRTEGYRKIGIKIKKIENGIVYTEGGLILEQFTKEKLKESFKSAGLKNFKIIKLNPISYLCEIKI